MQLFPREKWRDRLVEEIIAADFFGFVISPGSIASFDPNSENRECANELEAAIVFSKPIVPILWEMPVRRRHLLPTEISELQHVSFEQFRLSKMKDDNAFNIAWERLWAACHAYGVRWANQSMHWYDLASHWDNNERHPDFLLTRSEMHSFELWVQTMPKNWEHVIEHPLMLHFIRANKHAHDRKGED
jgi:hypothetical protein